MRYFLAKRAEGPALYVADRIDSLHRALADIFPVLRDVEVTHSWFGHVAMNRDMIPRIFSRGGMRYACGYCGSGVVWARWAGQKAAWQSLGDERGQSALDLRPPPAVPLYSGTPWFLPAVYGPSVYYDKVADTERIMRAFNKLRELAWSPEETRRRLEEE